MESAILSARGLVMDFGGVHAVNHCSLRLAEGSITGLIGPNGAGKTTLFNLITGVRKPTRGRILFRGERIDGLPPYRIFQKGVVRTFQIPRELKKMRVIDNLMIVPSGQIGESMWRAIAFPWAVKRQERAIADQARGVLDFVGLSESANLLAENLSGGQKKLLELARALMAKPSLVLLDEPGAGVNPTLMRRLTDGVSRARDERGVAFLIIEHDMDLVMRLCDRVIVMSEGSVLIEGAPADVQRNERVVRAYLGG